MRLTSEQLAEKVFETLADDIFTSDGPPLHLLSDASADWSGFAHWMLARVMAVNDTGGPRTVPRPSRFMSHGWQLLLQP